MTFKRFQIFEIQSFIIWKFAKILEFFPTFCFFQLFQMISYLKKPVRLYHVMLKQWMNIFLYCVKCPDMLWNPISINWNSAFVNSRFQEVTKFSSFQYEQLFWFLNHLEQYNMTYWPRETQYDKTFYKHL